ncbi:hypothetical protein SteCoe_24801 [Stentor coeruleus]|uniref:Uncharacterized protein n=1 Tax=Stentor coeruleus TaxID=5963 RepID=A0A1R2BGS5_9CILI|nr:hypothetical protein SteCoe_24801 [Stentor coeruleus]
MVESSSPISFSKSSITSFIDSSLRFRRPRLAFPNLYEILSSPNHRASVETNLYRIPDGSGAIIPGSRELEYKWDNRFHITFSKDNHKAYTQLREYFDSPRKFEGGLEKSKENYGRRFRFGRKVRFNSLIGDRDKEKERESIWSTRYTASSEWNEVKHKTLRSYFDELPKQVI